MAKTVKIELLQRWGPNPAGAVIEVSERFANRHIADGWARAAAAPATKPRKPRSAKPKPAAGATVEVDADPGDVEGDSPAE